MIFTGFNDKNGALEDFVTAQDLCSYCNQPLVNCKIIIWKFHHCDVWLHAICALNLAHHLQSDAFKAIPEA